MKAATAKHVFWGAIVASSIIIALLFLYSNTMDFLNATVRTNNDILTNMMGRNFDARCLLKLRAKKEYSC